MKNTGKRTLLFLVLSMVISLFAGDDPDGKAALLNCNDQSNVLRLQELREGIARVLDDPQKVMAIMEELDAQKDRLGSKGTGVCEIDEQPLPCVRKTRIQCVSPEVFVTSGGDDEGPIVDIPSRMPEEEQPLLPQKCADRWCALPRTCCGGMLSLIRCCLHGKEMDLSTLVREAVQVNQEKLEIDAALEGARIACDLDRDSRRRQHEEERRRRRQQNASGASALVTAQPGIQGHAHDDEMRLEINKECCYNLCFSPSPREFGAAAAV